MLTPRTGFALALLCALALPAPAAHARDGRDVVRALEKGLRGDVEERRAAIIDVGRLSALLDERETRQAALALRRVFPDEPDAEARRLMVRAMARLEDKNAWVPVLLASQHDRDPSVQRAARQEVLRGKGDFLEVVRTIFQEETSDTFKAELLLVLRDRRRADAVPLLIEALDDSSGRVVAAAAEALEATTGQALGYDAERWKTWRAQRRPSAAPDEDGPASAAPDSGPVEEPPPHVTRSLVPEFYGLPLRAKDIVFVVDISGSVGASGVERAKRELIDAVERLGSDVRVSALFFSEEMKIWEPETVPATPANKEGLAKFLRAVKPGRRTDVFSPLNAGLQIVRRRIEAKKQAKEPFRHPVTMIVVSDGRDNVGKTPLRVVADKLDRLDLSRAVVHAVVLGGDDSPLLAMLARRASGHYVRAGER